MIIHHNYIEFIPMYPHYMALIPRMQNWSNIQISINLIHHTGFF